MFNAFPPKFSSPGCQTTLNQPFYNASTNGFDKVNVWISPPQNPSLPPFCHTMHDKTYSELTASSCRRIGIILPKGREVS
mmetsp:Transcript_52192/g.62878  ORF Transcript_52192/g.62878 Transcript_52192/m.62878 type:complete len:80 (-) Transcript_52192:97-336(-)